MGVIPDLLLGPEKRLVDIKTVCAKKYYRSGLIRGAAGSGEGRRKRKLADSPRQTPLTETYGAPVDERALTVHSEYFAKAVECDREYNIYDEDAMTGPMSFSWGGFTYTDECIADETCAASFLAKTRDAIAFAASYGVVFLLLTALVFLVYGCLALKAAGGSVSAARRVYVFTTALAVLCVFGLFDETGFVALILTAYAAVVPDRTGSSSKRPRRRP